jgi:UDP:flavonoid glycosyltransferase YjiC (YdhE family)
VPAGDGPLVLAADSTASTPGLGTLIDVALAGLPQAGVRVLGTKFGAYAGVVPEGCAVASGPQEPVLPHVATVVFPGGHGLLVKTLRHGVPVVIVPGPGDQAGNALRVEMLGCGVRLAPDKLTPDTLRAAVLEVVGNPRYRQSAERIAKSGAGLGATHAATVVEDIMQTHNSRGGLDPGADRNAPVDTRP